MNKVILIGIVASDIDSHAMQNGVMRVTFRLAVSRQYKNADGKYESDFLTCVAWRQTAEMCNNYLHKGNRVGVEGAIQTRQYTGSDGSKRTATEIVIDRVEFLTPRGSGETKEKGEPDAQGFTEVDDEGLPF